MPTSCKKPINSFVKSAGSAGKEPKVLSILGLKYAEARSQIGENVELLREPENVIPWILLLVLVVISYIIEMSSLLLLSRKHVMSKV